MKNLLLILLLLPSLCMAQVFHAVAIDLAGGFAGERVGATSGVHVGYEMSYRHFLLNLGLGVGYDYLQRPADDWSETFPAIDSEKVPYTRVNNYTNCVDHAHELELQVPLRLGGEWERFYFLLGATAGYRVWGKVQQHAELTSHGEYDMFYDPFAGMPNHGFGTEPYLSDWRGENGAFRLYGSGELGLKINERYRLGIYADYPVYKANLPTLYRVGLRFTMRFGRTSRPHYPCRCLEQD